MSNLRAPMKWSENRQHLRLLLDLRDIKNEKVTIEPTKLTITCESWNKTYSETLELLKEVDTEKSSHNKTAFRLEVMLIKKEKDKWNKVTANDKKYRLKVDWDHFEDSELSSEDESPGMGGMGGMPGMPGMGGMPGMPGMPGMGGMGGMPGMGGGMGGMDMAKMMEAMKNMKGGGGLGKMGDMPVGEDSDDESSDDSVEKLDDLEGDIKEQPKAEEPKQEKPAEAKPTEEKPAEVQPETEIKKDN